jgi:hypothetical protein
MSWRPRADLLDHDREYFLLALLLFGRKMSPVPYLPFSARGCPARE